MRCVPINLEAAHMHIDRLLRHIRNADEQHREAKNVVHTRVLIVSIAWVQLEHSSITLPFVRNYAY